MILQTTLENLIPHVFFIRPREILHVEAFDSV